jgi:hypothetical protein
MTHLPEGCFSVQSRWMGRPADRAYEKAQEKVFQDWRASLTWREYLGWQWQRWRHFLAGAATAAAWCLVVWLLFG